VLAGFAILRLKEGRELLTLVVVVAEVILLFWAVQAVQVS
jgi:hypothetical protein